jgi:hypothetical protein
MTVGVRSLTTRRDRDGTARWSAGLMVTEFDDYANRRGLRLRQNILIYWSVEGPQLRL